MRQREKSGQTDRIGRRGREGVVGGKSLKCRASYFNQPAKVAAIDQLAPFSEHLAHDLSHLWKSHHHRHHLRCGSMKVHCFSQWQISEAGFGGFGGTPFIIIISMASFGGFEGALFIRVCMVYKVLVGRAPIVIFRIFLLVIAIIVIVMINDFHLMIVNNQKTITVTTNDVTGQMRVW